MSITSSSCSNHIYGSIDIGSGTIKLAIAKVNYREQQLIETLCNVNAVLLIAQGLTNSSKPNKFDEPLIEKILETLTFLFDKAEKQVGFSLENIQCRGVATAAFRNAENGKLVVQMLEKHFPNTKFDVVNQQVEAKLGYETAQVLYNSSIVKEKQTIIAYDSGAGSFQISSQQENKTLETFCGKVGSTSVTKAFIESIQGKTFTKVQSTNPVENFQACEQFEAMLEKNLFTNNSLSDWVVKNNVDKRAVVICIGGEHSIFNNARKVLQTNLLNDVNKLRLFIRENLINVNDEFIENKLGFDQPGMLIPKLILFIVVAKQLMASGRVTHIEYHRSNGSCPAIFFFQ